MQHKAARALGITGIAMGIAELAIPRILNNLLGVREHNMLLRALGAREIATSLGVLFRRAPSVGLWGRVLGDVVDAGLLGLAVRRSSKRKVVFGALAAVTALGVFDVYVAWRERQAERDAARHAARAWGSTGAGATTLTGKLVH